MSKPGRLTVAFGVLALAFCARAADPTISFEIDRHLRQSVVRAEDDGEAVHVWYHVGAANQAAGRLNQ